MEIGVHHGKLYILMNQVIAETETFYAVDPFDNQDLDIDHFGLGAIDMFRVNLAKCDRHGGRNTAIVSGRFDGSLARTRSADWGRNAPTDFR